jgi:NAD(P)-dependent dehydrogenase (short-subunit alcohol dehydrogenase family)
MNTFSLKGKTILVTGASSGIGASCCKLLSRNGANILLSGRDKARLSDVLRELMPGDHSVLSFDLSNIEDIEAELIPVLEKYRKIDGFIHSAGIDITLPIANLTYSHYQNIFKINVFSALEISRILSKKKFIPDGGSSFVFISSIMGLTGSSGKTAYSASKGALISACRSMAIEFVSKKIRVNCISPAIVQTKLVEDLFLNLSDEAVNSIVKSHPSGLGKPEDIASACLYLISEESRWVTGSNLVIDGGYSIV